MRQRTPSAPSEAQVPAPGGAGGEAPRTTRGPGGAPPSWRKRHPVLARFVLYALGLALAGGGTWLWWQRREQDRGDRLRYLWSRLETLPMVIQADPEGLEAQKVLDAELSDPSLPDDLEARAQRLRAIVARLRRDLDGVNHAFAKARNLDLTPDAVDAVTLEWAECRIVLGDLVGARQLLNTSRPRHDVLALWKPVIEAHLAAASGPPEDARSVLRATLDQLPRPLPKSARVWFMLNEWRVEDVMVEAVRWLVAGLPEGSPAALPLWRQLAESCPDYLPALVAATEGLLAARDRTGARELWKRIRRMDTVFAAKEAQRNPSLASLEAT